MNKIKAISDLNNYQIRFIVTQFATYQTSCDIKEQFLFFYGQQIEADLIEKMNPENDEFDLGSEWLDYWRAVKQKVMDFKLQPLAANLFHRLYLLQGMLNEAETRGDGDMILKVLNQFRLETEPPYHELVGLLKTNDPVSYVNIPKKFEA